MRFQNHSVSGEAAPRSPPVPGIVLMSPIVVLSAVDGTLEHPVEPWGGAGQ